MEVNKEEKDKDFYDDVYKKGGMYAKHYQASPYFEIWKKSIDIIKEIESPDILEIGCGVGQFANMLFDQGFKEYKGFDYSDEAIKLAQQTNPYEHKKFHVDNAYNSKIFQEDYNTIIIYEVLEHLKEDILVLNKIKKGVNVLFSVPNFDSASHVRYFQDKNDITQRYSEVIDIKDIYAFHISTRNIIYLGHGIKK
ncbi:class I SAM-dependent methyltransferase [Ferdinandcohnia sp. Marseille-Q9671]